TYVADSYLLRRIAFDGTMSVVAGGSYTGALDVVFDPASGSVYFAESNRILKMASAAVVATVAGNGIPGFAGDGGPARAWQVFLTQGVTVDGGREPLHSRH